MTTPDAQARLLSGAIKRQRLQQDAAREVAREIARDRASAQDGDTEREAE